MKNCEKNGRWKMPIVKKLSNCHGPFTVFPHPDPQVRQTLYNIIGNTRVHGGTQKHNAARMKVHQLVNEIPVCTDNTGNSVAGAVNKLGHGRDHNVGTECCRRYNHGHEGVVNH